MGDDQRKPVSPQRSFLDREIARLRDHIQSFKAKDTTGQWAFYVMLVEPGRQRAFRKAIDAGGMIDLRDFGRLLASNYGLEPTEDVKAMLKTRYGYDA